MKNNILFVIPSLAPGGAEHQTINQINYLIEGGNEHIRLLVLSKQVSLLHELKLKPEHVKIIYDNEVGGIDAPLIKKLPLLIRKTRAIIREEKISDIISIMPMAHVVCRLALASLTFTDLRPELNVYFRSINYTLTPPDTWQKKLFEFVSSTLARRFDTRSLFISQAVLKDISANFFVRNPLVLPNSLPCRSIDAQTGEAYLEAQKFTPKYKILVPGRLHPTKGHLLFLEAFHDFVREQQLSPEQVRVFIAGEGAMREAIIQKIETLGLESFFYLNGYTDNELLLSLHKCMDLVVIPSHHEGFGNVAIEGLMQQSLLLASRTGGLAEIIRDGENGFTFENGNAQSLKEKLVYLYTNRQEELLDRQALHSEFLSKYTIDRQMEAIRNHCELEWRVPQRKPVPLPESANQASECDSR